MVKFGLRQHPSEASVNVSSTSDYFWMFSEDLLVVWFGMDRFEASVKVS